MKIKICYCGEEFTYKNSKKKYCSKTCKDRACNARREFIDPPGYRRWIRYGITPDQYEALLLIQEGKCKLCKKTEDTFCVDHDHRCCPGRKSCGKCIRGLLCTQCNQGMGLLLDSPTLLRAAADYIEEFEGDIVPEAVGPRPRFSKELELCLT